MGSVLGRLCAAPSETGQRERAKERQKLALGGDFDPIDNLSDAQLEEFRGAFRQFDRDGGGSIDAAELKALMASVGQVPSDEEVAEMVRIADADGSGSIDFPEFVTLMAHKMAEVENIELVEEAFKIFDESGDGYISASEMRKIMINIGEPVTMEDCEQLIREVDDNADGHISFTEFSKVVISKGTFARDGIFGSTEHLSAIGTHGASPMHQPNAINDTVNLFAAPSGADADLAEPPRQAAHKGRPRKR